MENARAVKQNVPLGSGAGGASTKLSAADASVPGVETDQLSGVDDVRLDPVHQLVGCDERRQVERGIQSVQPEEVPVRARRWAGPGVAALPGGGHGLDRFGGHSILRYLLDPRVYVEH